MTQKKSRPTAFPLGKINTIMESSSKRGHVPRTSLTMVAKVTELFIQTLTKECYNEAKGNKLDYEDIMKVVHGSSRYKFLKDIVPKKITVLEYKQIMAEKEAEKRRRNNTGNSSDDETSRSSGFDESGGTSEEEAAPASPGNE
ncbi:unnamed protein product [Ceutorhynchus assimilis]|uniref:Transcription factor CBF/NF-Y/archaeal histone domain-containing protein n=1 Tax=Ceutorhynchus assimilis TaxID=467358 RepID=A0A9N9QJE7_9CUCU|nr:unnamed protein product [Ceutorhynchus assimilis]